MITTALGFFASVFIIMFLFNYLSSKLHWKLFKIIPPLIFLIIFLLVASQLGLWDVSEGSAVLSARTAAQSVGIPFMVFFVCLASDARQMLKLGKRLTGIYIATCVSITLGIIVSALLFAGKLNMEYTAGSYGALLGMSIGGPENLYAISDTLNFSQTALTEAILLDTTFYSFWMTILMTIIPIIGPKFNKWTKADMTDIDSMKHIENEEVRPTTPMDIFTILGVSFAVVFGSTMLGNLIQSITGWNATLVMYMLVTIIGLGLGTFTKLGKLPLVDCLVTVVSSFFLMLCFIGFDLSLLASAGYYIIAGWTVVLVHVVVMVLYAKLARADIYSMGCASIATFGGNSSAPVVAACYGNKVYITISSIMASIGVVIGTVLGISVTNLLNSIL